MIPVPTRRRPVPRTHGAYTVPPPVGGLNRRDVLVGQNEKDAWVLNNWIARPSGPELREGFMRWVDAALAPGKTLLPYAAARALSETDSRLFMAATDQAIYDVTDPHLPTDPPLVPAVTISGQINPGVMSWVHLVNPGGVFMLVVAEGGGYYTYDALGGWIDHPAGTAAGQLEFPTDDLTTPADFAYVFTWKSRAMFIKKNSGLVYYLPPNQIAGKLGVFDFGAMLVHGGDLQMAQNWTVDAGDGIDDKLVLAGSQGDLLIYSGTNIADADQFRMDGRWYIGRVPSGRRFMDRYGGDLMMISDKGFAFLSELLRGQGLYLEQEIAAGKINPLIAPLISHTLDLEFWELRMYMNEQLLLINTPGMGVSEIDALLVQEMNGKGWSTFSGLPIRTMEVYRNQLYFCDDVGIVYLYGNEAQTDDILADGTPGTLIEGDMQTAWVAGGESIRRKRMLMVKPQFLAEAQPQVKAQINVDWTSQGIPGSPEYIAEARARWDIARWDQARWAGAPQTYQAMIGVEGTGFYAALKMKVQGPPRTRFVAWTLVTEQGGIM